MKKIITIWILSIFCTLKINAQGTLSYTSCETINNIKNANTVDQVIDLLTN